MDISKNIEGKQLRAAYDKWLTQTSATQDTDRILAKYVCIGENDPVDEWEEIDSAEAERIRKAKSASKGEIEYPEEQVNQVLTLFAMKINSLELTNEEALAVKGLYPTWESFIGKSLSTGTIVLYADKLYKVRQEISVVLQNQYPSVDTAALYEEINESNAGTYDDPIPYNNNMALENGKYYIQNEVIYLCNRDTEIPVYQDLSALVGIYVEIATKE